MVLKASIVQVLETERSMCVINKHFCSIVLHRYLLYLVAIAKKPYNILMVKLGEVMELILELLIVVEISDIITKLLHSNMLAIFSQTLLKI